MSDTPRTDAKAMTVWDGQNFEVVPVAFARELEREKPPSDADKKLAVGTHVLMPVKADGEMAQAIENYYASITKYRDRPHCDALKADCWMALMAYYAMVEVVKNAAPQAYLGGALSSAAKHEPAVAAPQEAIASKHGSKA